MAIDPEALKRLVASEIDSISDARVADHLRAMLIEPRCVNGLWDYGPETTYPCWIVLEHPTFNASIAYCEHGFGPKCPWGLLGKTGSEDARRMGMDSGWYDTLLKAALESWLITDLPIFRVCRLETSGRWLPLSSELSEEEAWAEAKSLNNASPGSSHCPLPDLQIAIVNAWYDRYEALTPPPPTP